MKINVSILKKVLNKVLVTGAKSLRITVGVSSKGGIMNFTCYDGKEIQVSQNVAYENPHDTDAGSYSVDAGQFSSLINSYDALGVAAVDLSFEEGGLTVTDEKGTTSIGYGKELAIIGNEEMRKGSRAKIMCDLHALQNALKATGVFSISNNANLASGFFFKRNPADEGGSYTVMTTNGFSCSRAELKVQIKTDEGVEDSTEALSFFASKSFGSAASILKADPGNGNLVQIIITEKYAILRDIEGTIAIVALGSFRFPYARVEGMFIKPDDAIPQEILEAAVSKERMLATLGITDSMATSANEHKVRLSALPDGEKSLLMVSSVGGSFKTSRDVGECVLKGAAADSLMIATEVMKKTLSVMGDKVSIRATKNCCYFYEDKYPFAVVMGVAERKTEEASKKSGKSEKAEKTE